MFSLYELKKKYSCIPSILSLYDITVGSKIISSFTGLHMNLKLLSFRKWGLNEMLTMSAYNCRKGKNRH